MRKVHPLGKSPIITEDRSGEKIIIDKKYVQKNLGELVKDTDLSKFIL